MEWLSEELSLETEGQLVRTSTGCVVELWSQLGDCVTKAVRLRNRTASAFCMEP